MDLDHYTRDTLVKAERKFDDLKRGPSRRKRRKRELLNLEVPVLSNEEAVALTNSLRVRGRESWAPLAQGSLKLVKRHGSKN